ncbi:MAG: PspA/IM30 family protein [Maricaulaceae bacterium]
MAEPLFSRVTRLVSASVNAVVEQVEAANPDMVMREALREIDAALFEVRDELGKTAAAKHVSAQRLLDANTRHEALSEQISLALAQSRDDLAEAAIAKQMDLEAQAQILEEAIAEAAERETELQSYVAALQGKRRDMEDELDTWSKAQAETATPDKDQSEDSAQAKVSNAEAAFDRVMSRASGVRGVDRGAADQAAKLAELETLSREHRIKERLAAAKARAPGAD